MKVFGLMDEQATAAVMEIPAPEPGSGEVRVRVRNSSVNGFDVSVAKGLLRGMMEHRYPVVGGKDFAGVVESVGEAVTDLAPGDEVAGVTPYEPVLSRGARRGGGRGVGAYAVNSRPARCHRGGDRLPGTPTGSDGSARASRRLLGRRRRRRAGRIPRASTR
jgi:NADPH:quinone reductase-like Zn-dependent oxidoreductase